jgi:hypothetical protein
MNLRAFYRPAVGIIVVPAGNFIEIGLSQFLSNCISKPLHSIRRAPPGVPNDRSLSLGWEPQGTAALHETKTGHRNSGTAVELV